MRVKNPPSPYEATPPNGASTQCWTTPASNQTMIRPSQSMDPILSSSEPDLQNADNQQSTLIKLSPQRWLVLIAFSLFGLSTALTDVTSPILTNFLRLMDMDVKDYLYLQLVASYFMMALAFPTAILVDKYGIKKSMHVAALLFFIHGILRAAIMFQDLPYHKQVRLPFYILSSITGAEMFTVYFLLPLKVSEAWFGASERSVAWAIMISQLSVGNCVASFVYPRIIRTVDQFEMLAYLDIACVVVTVITSLAFVTRSEPEHPPSDRVMKSRQETPKSFRKSIMKLLRHRDILIHLVHISIFEALYLVITSVIQPILKSIGYSEIFTGNLMSFNALMTIVMQVILSCFVHGITNRTLICKLGSFVQGSLFVAFLVCVIVPQASWLIITISIVSTTVKAWFTPNFTDMTAHLAAGTVSLATVIGLSMFITVMAMTVINVIFTKLIMISPTGQQHYGYSLLFSSILCAINIIFYLGFFYGRPAKTNDE